MKANFDLIKNIYADIIRHNLSQPEEIDQALLLMAAEDLAISTPIAGGMKLLDAVNNERNEYAAMAGFSDGMAHKKSVQRVPDHYMFFASRNVLKLHK